MRMGKIMHISPWRCKHLDDCAATAYIALDLGDGGCLMLCRACFEVIVSTVMRDVLRDALAHAVRSRVPFDSLIPCQCQVSVETRRCE